MPATITRLPAPTQHHETACRPDDLLAEGLRWLHDTPQPPTAVIDCRGAAARMASANRVIRFVPLGWAWKASIVVDVAHVHWGAGMGPPLNPMPSSEIIALAAALHRCGANIDDIRCSTTALCATVALTRPAHCTLRAAVRRFMGGCPTHHSRICARPNSRGGHHCSWYGDGQSGVIWPFCPQAAHHAAQPDQTSTGIEVHQR